MSDAVAAVLGGGGVLVAEAGTGVGKTFAYLVPALLSGLKIIVSTGTRHLQDQLFHRDLPRVKSCIGLRLNAALLKGRANYVCLHRLYKAEGEIRNREQLSQLQGIKAWSGVTRSGDIAELSDIPEDAPVWRRATSTAENCLGQECPEFSKCFLVKARRQAQQADVVVINHHLFFADMALKEEGFGEVLPAADAFILDEAHQLPETASRFFGQMLSHRQLGDLANDTVAAQLKEAADMSQLRALADTLEQQVREFNLVLAGAGERSAWYQLSRDSRVTDAFNELLRRIETLAEALQKVAERGDELRQCAGRAALFLSRMRLFRETPEDLVLWVESSRTGFSLHATPQEISGLFQQYMQGFNAAWVFTSATLSVAGSFEHFVQQLGLDDPVIEAFDSPYDYRRQALLYLPSGMPEPNAPDFLDRFVDMVRPVLAASRGRAFILFTSYRSLQYVAESLRGDFSHPLFVQGDAPRSQLLDRFRESQGGVLLGTSSFWEGVDIKGEALSCVIIEKLPFAAPNDPVLQARLELLRKLGSNPFMSYQVPQAAIALKQGVGRLLRDPLDRGVVVIADARLKTKPYGRVFLESLPPMPVTSDIADVRDFFKI
jgi:ATP-dependent DNA helicase DinG